MTRDDILNLADRIASGHELTHDEARRLVGDDTALDDLVAGASALSHRLSGSEIEFCSIVNARAGRCPNDCAFCAQSAHHDTAAPTYDLLGIDEIVLAAREAAASGACRFSLVTSGPAAVDDDDFDRLCRAVGEIAALGALSVCASLGTLTLAQAHRLKTAGLTRCHHNLETSQKHYPRICTTQDYASKLDTLRAARAAGLELCSGGIFGLGETWQDRLDMAAALRELAVDAVAVNFLVPIPGTPLEHQQTLHADEALRIIALYRFILPRAAIKLCGGRELVLGDRQPDIFAAGADGAIIGNYLTTPGRPPADDLAMAAALGLTIRTHTPTTEVP